MARIGNQSGGIWLKADSRRILFLLTQDLESPSGLGRYWPLAQALAKRGWFVRIATLHSDWSSLAEKKYEKNGVIVEYVAPMHVRKTSDAKLYYSQVNLLLVSLRATWALSRAALTGTAEIIHVGKPHPMNSIAGIIGSRKKGSLLCLDCDDYEAGSNRFGKKWQQRVVIFFEKRIPRNARLVTTNTLFMKSKLLSWGCPPERIFYLSNGIDRNRFGSSDDVEVKRLRKELELDGKRVVLFLGSLSLTSHPVDLLLKAFVRIQGTHPDTVLLIVGGGEDYSTMVEQVKSLGIEHVTRFTGRVPPTQVRNYYSLADVSVDPVYDDESARGRSPLKLFESWICGVPFVSSPVGDRPHLLGEPPAGILSERAGDPESLAEAILRVLESANLANELHQRGLEEVENYTWDRLAVNLELEYKKILSGS